MENKKLFVAIAACLLLTSCFAIPGVFSSQPPVDQTTFYVGTIGQPNQVDPARAYDTASGELIFNVYEPLIWFSDKPVLPPTTMQVTPDYVAALGEFVPVVASALPTLDVTGKIWNFTIEAGHKFQPWTAANGTVYSNQEVTAEDVEYSFRRMFVQDQTGSPQGMLAFPSCGVMFFDIFDSNALTNTIEPLNTNGAGERKVRDLITNFCRREGNIVTFNFSAKDFPASAIWQSFAQSWGSIVNKAFAIEHGCWDGNFNDGWSTDYRRKPSTTYSPLDQWYVKSKYPESSPAVPAMCGSGPYKFNYWDKANLEWRADKFDDYNGGWAGSHVNSVIVKGIPSWPTRKMMFLAGEFDNAAVPTANMMDLLNPADPTRHTPLEGITLYYGMPALSNGMMFYTFTVDPTSPYVSKVAGVNKPNFFNDTHIRKAFCYALNFTTYMMAAWYNEAAQPYSWWVVGLAPDYENRAIKRYDINTTAIQEELTAAGVWTSGFETYALYNLGNTARQLAAEGVRDTFASLGSRFKVNVIGNDWPVILNDMEAMKMPVWFIGWLADYADPDNFARPYMHSQGDFSMYQGYNRPDVDAMIDAAAGMPNGDLRNATYQTLQQIFHDDAVSLPLYQGVGRRWQRSWVNGWYYNQLFPGNYYYDLYKATVTEKPVDLDVTSTITAVVTYDHCYYAPNGALLVGGGNGTAATYVYDVHVKRLTDTSLLATVLAAVGVRRTLYNKTNPSQILMTDFVNAGTLPLANGQDKTITLSWTETGALKAQFKSNSTWQMSGEIAAVTSEANDTNLANNKVQGNTMYAQSGLVADLKYDGKVNILDAIVLSNVFGKKEGDTGWNAEADLKPDLKINILDAIVLANNFGKYMPIAPYT